EQPGGMAGHVVSRGRRTRTHDRISRALLCATVIMIGVVNIRREVDLDTSLVYGETMASPAIFWSHYLHRFGASKAAVDSPLGWRPEFPRLFAPHADLCAARWLNQWQRCPDARVIIFEP